ncbi:MAG: MetQ/NlpA family ABC transporter substrate-binding protein [Clostridiales Family XIII bacterium]|jgi:D-methionine transport system substrate-binding protein|nr:MetQ/NlpA family ABC transporter substrate-binding protein [Clostridiales Family XIII bacterium]
MKALKKGHKLSLVVLALILAMGLFAGCSSSSDDEATSADAGADDAVVLVVGASPAPHAEILAQVVEDLAAEGYTLDIQEFTDYVLPNTALDSGDLTANYFQHKPYLDSFNEENGTDLVAVAPIHFEPIGLYPGKTASLDALADGATIAVPNDPTNEARALLLLEAEGLIKLKDGVGLEATKTDIVENTKNLEIQEVEAAQLPNILPDVDLAVINGNYAIEANLSIGTDALAAEKADSTAADEFANYIVVKAGSENDAAVLALVKALQSDKIRAFIESTYDGAVVPVF